MWLTLGSTVLGLATVGSTYLFAHDHHSAGCIYALALQAPASAYDIITGQYGFLVISLASTIVCVRALVDVPIDVVNG
jgi:hypothetical protein